ncbi:hypothetical protein QAD02_017146 [Eretmocerus hayati]|uniref:Uncharacterized protein n=1 Tax=Eretmocerus hayati TaxID=131215 RepID=A0ACC2PDI4_9HYME|nr:hypothetical protein QAD02_017146 [Eretmocerus hayati]
MHRCIAEGWEYRRQARHRRGQRVARKGHSEHVIRCSAQTCTPLSVKELLVALKQPPRRRRRGTKDERHRSSTRSRTIRSGALGVREHQNQEIAKPKKQATRKQQGGAWRWR